MIRFVLFLAFVWVGLTGEVSLGNLVFSVALAVFVLFLARPLGPRPVFAHVRPLRALRFLLYVASEIVVANFRVAAAVLGPRSLLRPAIVAIPLELTRDDEIALLAAIINLTPGTLSLDVSPDRKVIYVHSMFTKSPESLRDSIKNGFERGIREALG